MPPLLRWAICLGLLVLSVFAWTHVLASNAHAALLQINTIQVLSGNGVGDEYFNWFFTVGMIAGVIGIKLGVIIRLVGAVARGR